MSHKHQLRKQRTGTIINATSKKQESDIIKALSLVVDSLSYEFDKKIFLVHEKQWHLKDIVSELQYSYPDMEFHYHFDSSALLHFN